MHDTLQSVVLVIHLILACAIIGLVLLQRSEGGGLGIGSGGGMGALASAQTTASVLSRTTAICATGFFITSLTLGVLANRHSESLGEKIGKMAPATATAPAVPGKPSTDPSAPAIVPTKMEQAPAPAKAVTPAKAPEKPKPAAPISK